MSFKAFMRFFETDKPVAEIQHVANLVVKDKHFPAEGEYEEILKYVQTNAHWRAPGQLNAFKETYAVYADGFNVGLEWPFSLDNISKNKPEHFNKLEADKKEILLGWISSNLEPFRTQGFISNRSSYTLKHSFQFSENGFHITNGQFKGAMLASDFKPKDYNALNWKFTLGKNAGVTVI